ncbi:DNA-3-methyladenine glycosylase I [Bulleidia sp. zg-1006]|uniref:DNA-3-methyladenine glycosylase I n=1 Tax=Bulleidia sp. zg-1006 TaxID=2806552 RepID=UPI00193A4BE6|nr:DNA-3-methyladenine glycosylase I [Bulleidia sp. zg-1006]QRG87268.1 DNA-3-methyladenine glycosylase I [Bulleidia sp. zg-1006]
MKRCLWANESDLMKRYHDEEWGRPCFQADSLFEILSLEIFQAGLSRSTILKRREGIRRAFDDFHIEKVASYSENDVKRLLNDNFVIHYERKIRAIIHNATLIKKMGEANFVQYCWSFVQGKPRIYHNKGSIGHDELSDLVSQSLKERGFQFCGSTTIYSFLSAGGIINNHEEDCVLK